LLAFPACRIGFGRVRSFEIASGAGPKEVVNVSKSTITRWWIRSWIPLVAAGVLIPSGIVALAAHDAGASDGYGRTMIALIAIGGLCAWCGFILQVIAWVGAVLNTEQLSDGRWFKALLVAGVIGILAMPAVGLGALVFGSMMVAYIVAGPDGLATEPQPTIPDKRTIKAWSDRGYAVAAGGLVVALGAARLTYQGGVLHGHTWLALALVSLGISVIVLGAVAVSAAWWGALFNAHNLPDQIWFKRLRWTGILATLTMPFVGLGALIAAIVLSAYQHSAPDGITKPPPRGRPRTGPRKFATGS
jgi:hypothetical protein